MEQHGTNVLANHDFKEASLSEMSVRWLLTFLLHALLSSYLSLLYPLTWIIRLKGCKVWDFMQ